MEKIWLKNYQAGVPEEIDTNWVKSVVEIFEQSFAKFADRPAFYCMGSTITYGELDKKSSQFADYCQNHMGLKKGDRLALMMPNVLQYPVALVGAMRAGLTIVNVNPLYTARELEHQLKDSGAQAIVIMENFAATLERVLPHTQVKQVILTKMGDMLSPLKGTIVNLVIKFVKKMVPAFNLPNATSFSTALSLGAGRRYEKPELNQDDIAFLQYTGGTTGVSKGAILTHGNITANVAQARAWIGTNLESGAEIIITPLPLYHIFSLTANCMVFSSLGALNVLIPNPRDLPGFVKELARWKFTAFTGVNTLFNGLLNNPEFPI